LKPNEEDILLWKQYQLGNETAFGQIFTRLYPSLFQFGCKMTAHSEVLEDCIQELFTELWQNRSQTEVLSVKAYLLKSLKYKLLRALSKKATTSMEDSERAYGFELSHESLLITNEENKELTDRVLKAFGELSSRQKEIIYLKFYQELSYEEISEVMNINYQVSRNLLYQAIKALKKLMAETALILLISSQFLVHSW
jgi:RNA polymerase sigma factor (sigma-70 family)